MESIRKPGRWLRKRGPQGDWELLGWLGEVALRWCFSTILYLWLCSSRQNCESAPLDGKQPLTWMVAGCFTAGLIVALHLLLSAQSCFWMLQTEKRPVCPPCFCCDFFALLEKRPSSKSLCFTVHADVLTPACCIPDHVLHWWCRDAEAELPLADSACWTRKPSSQQLNFY